MQGKAGQGSGDTVDVKVLLEFLKTMHNTKEAEAQHIKSHIEMLDKDIRQVLTYGQAYPSPCYRASKAASIPLGRMECQ